MQAGYVVALSDYEGLGTPGRHPYLVGRSEGRSVLDAAQAAAQAPDAAVGDRYAIVGYSRTDETSELWVDLLEANDPGRVATDTPVLILHSRTDELLPASTSERLHDRMCAAGQTVERRTYDDGQTHAAAVVDAYADAFTWIDGLMNGATTPRSTCP